MPRGKPEYKKAGSVIKVTDFLNYREYLEAVYHWIKKRSKSYTYIKFADELGFSETNVIRLVISNQRNLSTTTGERVTGALDLKGKERRYFLTLVRHGNARDGEQRELIFQEMINLKQQTISTENQAKLEYFSEWYHPIVREMCHLKDFKSEAKWIANRFNHRITEGQAEASLKLLETLELIYFDHKSGVVVISKGSPEVLAPQLF